jgi:hypothetical protein
LSETVVLTPAEPAKTPAPAAKTAPEPKKKIETEGHDGNPKSNLNIF